MRSAHRTLMFALALALSSPGCKPHHDEHGELRRCEQRRIKKIYAIPGTLLLIQSSNIEVETFDGSVVGQSQVTFTLREGDASQGQAALMPAKDCAAGSAACYSVTCVGTGDSQASDEGTGFITASVRVGVTVDDDTCRDQSEIWIECLKPSDEQTCDRCVERIDVAEAAALGSACLGPVLLKGEQAVREGCLDDDACAALWSCQQYSLCHVPNAATCFCGALDAPGACTDSGFDARGDCATEELAAFEAQMMREPTSNRELLEKMFDLLDAPSGFPSLAAAHTLSRECLRPDGSAAPASRELFEASGLGHEAVDTCVDACFR